MSEITRLSPVDDNIFQVAWESTLKCNLNCSYCGDGHDNSIEHPDLESSLKTIDFIIDYITIQMRYRKNKQAGLNIQGGESIFHPHIIEILEYANEKTKNLEWQLYINTITNAVVKDKVWKRVVPLLNFFTVSFHSEASFEQQEQVRRNILYLVKQNKNFHVSVMMHPKYWDTCISMVEWCKEHNIKYNVRQLDHLWSEFRFNYTKEQIKYITGSAPASIIQIVKSVMTNGIDLSAQSRECCGGNLLCTNKDSSVKRVVNKFKGWHCSVDKCFLYIRQTTGEVFTNKDCRMNFDGKVGPIGYLSDTKSILDRVSRGTDTIICKKSSCWCGLCAPKADSKENYDIVMSRFSTKNLIREI
jgi:sulfatase maturation enzyme AslB (radical SAM superfamily)